MSALLLNPAQSVAGYNLYKGVFDQIPWLVVNWIVRISMMKLMPQISKRKVECRLHIIKFSKNRVFAGPKYSTGVGNGQVVFGYVVLGPCARVL